MDDNCFELKEEAKRLKISLKIPIVAITREVKYCRKLIDSLLIENEIENLSLLKEYAGDVMKHLDRAKKQTQNSSEEVQGVSTAYI